jgi:CheY-like chemotaxis protein/two-component sensor histidine kinase
MARQTQQLVLLVDDLLDVSRITLGTLKLNRQRVAVSEIVQSAVEECQVLIREARHDLRLAVPAEPIYVYADPSRLTQALSNLLNNAVRYTPPGGTIWMSAAVEDGEVVFAVKDTGVGVPADKLESIFEMFNRLESSSEEDPGLGIGLTLVRRLIEMHGGRIEAQSQGVNQGSTFTMRLPLRELGEGQPAERQHPLPSRRLRLLIVDDNQAAAEMLGMVMESRGHEIRIGSDGRQAVALAEEFRPEVVLMDLGMPIVNGYEAARQIRRQPWGSEMVLVALSGWGKEEDKRRSKEAGFDSHLVKPVETAELERLLATLGQRPA